MAGEEELGCNRKDGIENDSGSKNLNDQTMSKELKYTAGSKIDEALEQGLKELEMLEKFYVHRGKIESAAEISLTLHRMRYGSKRKQ